MGAEARGRGEELTADVAWCGRRRLVRVAVPARQVFGEVELPVINR